MNVLSSRSTNAASAQMRSGLRSYIGSAVHVAIGRNPRVLSSFARLYLDHAATTPVLPEAREAMALAFSSWANPSSPHENGRGARALLEKARRSIAEALQWPHDVILTSGATEAIAIATTRAKVPGRAYGATEHDAVGSAMGRAKVIPVDPTGQLDFDAVDEALAGDPTLIAVQHVNNETGVIQPMPELLERIRSRGSLALVDCAQSAGKLRLPGADLIAISGHKFGGPPGCGALLVRDIAVLRASGGQERGYRRGTENLPAAAAMAAALQSKAFLGAMDEMARLRSKLEAGIVAAGGIVIAPESLRIPTIGAYAMPGVASASQLAQFDLAGISISAGSACSSGSMKPSRVLSAMSIPADVGGSAIRVSFGPSTSESDIDHFLVEWRRIRERSKARAA